MNLQSTKLPLLYFFQYKARFAFLVAEDVKMFKVNNKDTRICKVNNKIKNKETTDVVLVTLFLTLSTFQSMLQCFYC